MQRILSLFAVVLLVAACESMPEEQAATGGEATQQAAAQTDGADTEDTGGQQAEVTGEPIPGPEGGTQEHLVVNVGDRVFFEFDKATLTSSAEETVTRLAAWLKQYPGTTVTVEGHADERGTREYNLALGARRASAVKDYLIVLGIDPNRIDTVTFGEERPAVLGSNEAAWAQNRRAVFVISEA